MKWKFWLATACLCVGLLRVTTAHEPGYIFQRCLVYASEIDAVNAKHDRLVNASEKISESLKDLQTRTEQSDQRLKSLFDQQAFANLQKRKVDWSIWSMTLQQRVNTNLSNTINAPVAPRLSQQRVNAHAQLELQSDMLQHQMQSMDEAGKIAIQQRITILRQLESLIKERTDLDAQFDKLTEDYWELSDLLAEKSDWELKAGLRALARTTDENQGASFARACTLMRLERLDEAQTMLENLTGVDGIDPAWVTCASAELLARQGRKTEAIQALRSLSNQASADSKVRMHRATIYAMLGRIKEAESDWVAVLKKGDHDIAARRAIAQLNLSSPNPTDHQKARALEHAQLACRLTDEEDWMSFMTVSIALAMNGQQNEAIESANKAADAAIGSQHQLCLTLTEQLKAGHTPPWPLP